MATVCEFLNCRNTSDDTKINRLRIHENLARKWDQVFNENLGDRIGEYLYICCAHFDSNTKKLILPKPIKEPGEIIEKNVKKEPVSSHASSAKKKRRASIEEPPPTRSSLFFNDDDDDEPLLTRKPRQAEPEPYFHTEQTFVEVEMEQPPEIKEEIHEEDFHETQPRSPAPLGKDFSPMVPQSMKPKVVLTGNLGKIKKKANVESDKKRYDKKKKELQKLLNEIQKCKTKNEFMQKDLVTTRNRINFIEINFGGAASKRNNPDFVEGNEF